MRLSLFVSLLAVIVVSSTFLLPVKPETMPLPPGVAPPPPTVARCLTLSYVGVKHPERLPRRLKLLADTTLWLFGRKTYRAVGDGDWLWENGYWSYAGADSIDVTAHHQPVFRVPRLGSGSGRGVPYLDGPLFFALFFPTEGHFLVRTNDAPCGAA
jgi:hypothetical protein